ncbi:MAG: D-alanyl-D-alanine carboxypeptidase family protein, partial [Solirubrobacteraceae bacterium]
MIGRIAGRVSAPAGLSMGLMLALAWPAAAAGLPSALVAGPHAPGWTAPAPALAATAAALYAPATGQLLFGDNVHAHRAIASTTKLMTALVTLEHVHHLSTVYAQNDWYPAPDDSQLGLVPGDRMSVHDLLIAMMLPSADDAAEDLAYNVGHGSVADFVSMMNAQARALHLNDTHYATPIGLDTPGNYSSAYDLVHLAAYDLSHSPYLRRVVALSGAEVRVNGVPRWVPNLNNLVGRYS